MRNALIGAGVAGIMMLAGGLVVAADAPLTAFAPQTTPDIIDITNSDLAKDFTKAAWSRNLMQHTPSALPTYQTIDHGTFFELNAQVDTVFTSSGLDNALYEQVFDAIGEWYQGGHNPDFIVVYKAWDPAEFFAFYSFQSNDATGIGYKHQIGQETFDQNGPQSNLQGFIYMSSLSQYNYGGSSRAVMNAFWGQEVGHRWGSFLYFDNDGFQSQALLGRDSSHWSYFMDSNWSVMEGNDWHDNGDGSFITHNSSFNSTPSYNHFDLYVMGLIPHTGVDDTFIILQPQGTNRQPSSPPELPFGGSIQTVRGTTQAVSIEDVIAAEGPRLPDWTRTQRRFKVAMLVISQEGAPLTANQVKLAGDYSDWMRDDFAINSRGLASLDLTTGPLPTNAPPKPAITVETTTIKAGQELTLDATGTTDPENESIAYVWEFGDDSADFETGATIGHVWNKKGTYTVTLLAVDASGMKDTTTLEITVEKAADETGCNCTVAPKDSHNLPVTLLTGLLAALGLVLIRRRRHI